ncbi:MAG: glycosyltransferase [Thermaurantimonas sp.]|uniref:glycosyltransferase n=1 Tax=Thermaurantimonas TaxID=2681566 RepID=UPI0023F56D89|nr:glycosyltransferase [Thermaurantimonas aggregans]MCX8148404.1 glycosyltransferase [Thermaurantimonas aggregans]
MTANTFKISAFSFLRNAVYYDLPFVESILSVLPIVDEFVIALAISDDTTLEILQSLHSEKIKIIHTDWKVSEFPKNTEYARQTDIAKIHCTGDWLLYVQGDEVYHEDDLPKLLQILNEAQSISEAEGILVQFFHFWGDYEHIHRSHAWYKEEIRLIRNLPQIHSWRDAQSFRYYLKTPTSATDYMSKSQSRKLRVVRSDVRVFHYGHVKKANIQLRKVQDAHATYTGNNRISQAFNYGRIADVPVFEGTHPAVMRERIHAFMNSPEKPNIYDKPNPALHKHERFKYKLLSFLENRFLGGKTLFGFKNYTLIK